MNYSTVMVHLETGQLNTGLLQVAGDFAEHFHADVIGVAARQPQQMVTGYEFMSPSEIDKDHAKIEKQIREAEAEFRHALRMCVGTLDWRSTITYGVLADYVAREARCADLVITRVASGILLDASRRVNTGDLVMRVGRPVLIVPTAAEKLKLERVVVGWKDTREARRAVFDALPLLKKADYVAIVEVAAEEELTTARAHLEDVARWLKRHGVVVEALAVPSTCEDAAHLVAIAEKQSADIIVAGVYGHSRLRESVFGGVTRDLLLRGERCSLVSH